MDPKLVTIISLRGLAMVLNLQGQTKAASAIEKTLAAYEAGANVDQHLREIANKLKDDTMDSWDNILTRIDDQVGEFLAR